MPEAAVNSVAMCEWPHLCSSTFYIIISVNILSLLACLVVLRIIWKPPTLEELRHQRRLEEHLVLLQKEYSTVPVQDPFECIEGDLAGDYSDNWTNTFDLAFLYIMFCLLVGLLLWTQYSNPELLSNFVFWCEQIAKVLLMMFFLYIGGLICRHFCDDDEKGYIITNRRSPFKVNYTRKLLNFVAYFISLFVHTNTSKNINGPLILSWSSWFTLLSFLALIKPLRERFDFLMLQFNSLDRPEDRPNTMVWIVVGNLLPGCSLIIFYRWLYEYTGLDPNMTNVFLFIVAIGDGIAEPVGVYFGKHKYWTTSFSSNRKYRRSFEGSACILWSSIVFLSIFYYTFYSQLQFWFAMMILPPLMSYSEAKSPHTLDTPFLMGLGGLALFIIGHISLIWY